MTNSGTFRGTDFKISDLTKWILEKYSGYKITEIRYFGSRMLGSPKENSDFDVYVLFNGDAPDRGPIFTDIYKHNGKKLQIEIHAFIDFNDKYIPKYLVGEAENVICK